MTISRIILTWALLISATISLTNSVVASQSPMSLPASAPGPMIPASDCTTLIFNMSDCISYVSKGSKTSKPDKACCPELAGMLDTNPICLCHLLEKNNKEVPIELDYNKALKLPSLCGLTTPPISMCSMVGIPIGVPTGAPAGAPTGALVGAPTSNSNAPSPGGMSQDASGPSPSPGKGSSGASNSNFKLFYLIACLAIVFTSLVF